MSKRVLDTILLSAMDGCTHLTVEDVILERYRQNMSMVCPSHITDNTTDKLSQIGCNVLLDELLIVETRKAFQQLSKLQV